MKIKIKKSKLNVRKEEQISLSLPEKKSTPSANIWDYGIMIHADKKLGKTSLASMIPDSFFMMTQPGAKSFALFQRPVKTWDQFKGYVKLLEKDRKFLRVVLDHVDGAYKACTKFICAKENWEHPDDGGGYGKGWGKVNDEFATWMDRLLSCGKGVVLLTHSSLKDIKTRTGDEYTKIMTTLSGGAWGILEQNIDLWIYLYYDGEKRMMQIVGDDHVGAGHNLNDHFKYTDGSTIRRIPMGKNKEEAYRNLISAFNNELERPVKVFKSDKHKQKENKK